MAEKIILRPEPYDPDAIDADGDGIVQERTPWERPAGTRLLDKFGDAITAGRSLTERPEGLQVVDDKGKPVRYIPSYGGGEAPAPTGKATPLADHGARSLREMGLPSIQSMTAPPPPQAAPDTIPKPVSRTKPVPVPEAPKRPRQPSPPPLSGRAQELADRAGGDWRRFAELLDQEGFVVFDYETTGFDNGNIPVQVGAVKIQNGKIVGRMNVYMNPERGLSGWSKDNLKDANGNPLTDEFLREQPSLAEAHQQLADFIGGGIIVAHNLPFDQEVIDRTMAEQGIPFTHAGGIDTLELARQILPKGDGGPESHALGPLTDHLGIPLEGWHTADADSAATGKVLGAILQNAVAKNADKKLLSGRHQKELHASAIEQYKKELDAYKKAKEEYDRAFQRGEDVLPPVPTPPEKPLSEEARQLLAPPRELPDLPKSITRPTAQQIGDLNAKQRTEFDDFAEAVQEAIDSEGLSDEQRTAISTIALNSFYWATSLADSSGTLTSSLNTLVGGILDADGAENLKDIFRWGGTAALAMPLLSMREKFDWSRQQMSYVAGRISESFKASKIKAGELSEAFKAKMASTFDKIIANFRAKRNPKIAKAAEVADVLNGYAMPESPTLETVSALEVSDLRVPSEWDVEDEVLPDWLADRVEAEPDADTREFLSRLLEEEDGWVDDEARLARLEEVENLLGEDYRAGIEFWYGEGGIPATEGMRDAVERDDQRDQPTQALMKLIDSSPTTTQPLYRGMRVTPEQKKQIMESGIIDFPIGAFSESSGSASEYAGDHYNPGVIFRLEPGAKAFPMKSFSPIDERELLVSGRFEVVAEETENVGGKSTPVLVIRAITPAGKRKPRPEARPRPGRRPRRRPAVERPEGFESLPSGQGVRFPEEAFGEVSENYGQLSNLVEYDDDQTLIRDAMEAFKTGDFDGLVEGANDLYGNDLDGPVNLADITNLVNETRAQAQRSVQREPNFRDGKIIMYRGGQVPSGSQRPISMTTSRAEAEEFGDVEEYEVPVDAVDAEGRSQSYAGEYLVDPSKVKKVVKPGDGKKLDPKDAEKINIREVDDSTPDGILAKNAAIEAKIEALGAPFGTVTEETRERLGTEGAEEYPRLTDAEKTAARKADQKKALKVIRDALSSDNLDEPLTDWQRLAEDNPDRGKLRLQAMLRQLSPENRRFLAEASDEEVLARVQDIAVRFHAGFEPTVFVQIPESGAFQGFLASGQYKTTFEEASRYSGTDIRGKYQATLGIPMDAPTDIRPASCYALHPDFGVDRGDLRTPDFSKSGDLSRIFGSIQMKLKPETAKRSKFVRGNSLTSVGAPVSFDETDPEKIANALIWGRQRESRATRDQIVKMLLADQNGTFDGVNQTPTEYGADSEFYETLVPGSFSLNEVEEISAPYEAFASMWKRTPEEMKEFLPVDVLRQRGLTEEEIDFIYNILDRGGVGFSGTNLLSGLAQLRFAEAEKARIEAMGPKVKLTTRFGEDPLRPDGASVDEYIKMRTEELLAGIKEMVIDDMERAAQPEEDDGVFEI